MKAEMRVQKSSSLKSFKVYKNIDQLKEELKQCKSIALISHVGKCWVCLKHKVKMATLHEVSFDCSTKKEVNGCSFFKLIIGTLKLENISHERVEEYCDAVVLAIPLMLCQNTFDDHYHCISSDWKELSPDQQQVCGSF